jgi:hypothetical protein
VASLTANPPQIHCTIIVPNIGTAEIILVITVAAQNLIWPQGKTYPKKAVNIKSKSIIIPDVQVFGVNLKD